MKTFIAAVIVMGAAGAHAQATRTWVSGVGDDANACTRAAPCRTFAGALAKTTANGAIDVVTPGSYGPVTITKSITIDGGGMASIHVPPDEKGVIINVTDVGDVAKSVRLRGLSIAGARVGGIGVEIVAGNSVTIEGCAISDLAGGGVVDARAAGAIALVILDTHVRNIANDAVRVAPTGASIYASLERVRATNNTGDGFTAVGATAYVTCIDCLAAHNVGSGVRAENGGRILVQRSTILNNGTGITEDNGAFASIGASTIAGNLTGISGGVDTYGDNAVSNVAGNTFPNTIVARQ